MKMNIEDLPGRELILYTTDPQSSHNEYLRFRQQFRPVLTFSLLPNFLKQIQSSQNIDKPTATELSFQKGIKEQLVLKRVTLGRSNKTRPDKRMLA